VKRRTLAIAGRLLQNRNFIFILALVFGLAIGKPGASLTVPSVLPLLALIMTVSALNISSRELTSIKDLSQIVLYSILLNYLILGGVILLLARWLIHDNELWAGFVVLAIIPPAPAVVPFSYSLGGNVLFSLIGMAGGYLAALIIIPLSLIYFFGTQSFDPLNLVLIVVELVIIPIMVSRLLLYFRLARYIERWRGVIVNWSIFIIIFTLIGLNRQVFFGDFEVLIRISVIAIAISFGLGYLLEVIGKTMRLKHETAVSVILMGTAKNYALAGGLLLSLFSERSAIPPAICVFFAIFQIVWLGFHFHKNG